MTAAELRKKLDEGVKVDNSGKSTPIQRLTPFLQELVTYLEVTEALATSRYKAQDESFEDHSGLTPPILFGSTKEAPQFREPKALEVYDKIIRDGGTEAEAIDAVNAMHVPDNPQVSSDDATRAATAQTNSESDGAPKEPA